MFLMIYQSKVSVASIYICFMQAKTEGIVFRTIKYSETSVIAGIYTEQFGLQSYIINSVRGKGKSNSKSSALAPLSVLNMEVYKKENKNINTLALCLDGERAGEVLDFYAGRVDLDDTH